MDKIITDTLGYKNFIKVEPIVKGWSEDKKYCVTKADDTKYLLRISPIERYEARKALFEMLKQVDALGISMCRPVDFGTCTDGVYSLQTWIDGKDLEVALPLLSETEQYVLGLQAGEALRKIHSLSAPTNVENWASRIMKEAKSKIENYRACGVRFPNDDAVIEYMYKNIFLAESRPQTFQHGDFSVSNMMLENGEIRIIDFDYSYGDPWQDFESIRWSVDKSNHFATGQIKGYFGGDAPEEFWSLLKLYLAQGCFHNIPWSVNTGDKEQIETSVRHTRDIVEWFDGFKNTEPTWYLTDFYIQWADGVPYKLKESFDFSFINKYGKVFKVFDDQDSGNICFGIQADDGKRYFVKFAGALTDRACVSAEEAIANLKRTVSIYRDLAHPTLIKYVDSEEIGGGFAMVFEWVDAECPHRMYPLSRRKFLQMSLETKIKVFEDIMIFHAHVAACGYVAIDFYDGSIMYDFENEKTVICDIDFYAKAPYINQMGRLWGSSRFMSPEEFTVGSAIDEITNVYTMGATAFALFGDERDRCIEKWKLSRELFDVAKRAVNDQRVLRQQSIRQLIEEWETAK